MNIIGLLVALLVLTVVMYVVYLLTAKFIADSTLRTIVLLILGLIGLLIVLGMFGIGPAVGVF